MSLFLDGSAIVVLTDEVCNITLTI